MSFQNWSMNIKVTALLLLLLATSLAGAIYASVKMASIDAVYSDLLSSESLAPRQVGRANQGIALVKAAIFQNATGTTPEENQKAVAARELAEKRFDENLVKAEALAPGFKDRLEEVRKSFRTAMDGVCGEATRLANSTDPEGNAKAAAHTVEKCAPALEALFAMTAKVNDEIQAFVDKSSSDGSAETSSVIFTMLAGIVGAGLSVLALAIYLTRGGIVLPMQKLMSNMSDIGKGQLNIHVEGTNRRDEIGELATTLDVLRKQLVEAEALRAEQARAQAQREERQRTVAAAIRQFEGVIGTVVDTVGKASSQLEDAATSLTSTAGSTQQLSSAVASASEQTSANVQGVAAASEQLASTVTEIGRQVQESSSIASRAVSQAAATNEQVTQLSEAANRIGDVVNLINTIAGQTNLLALNATIEAARAGDAGKGFAVVAQEVKALAAQTAKATSEIGSQIASMQAATNEAVSAIQEITTTINRMSEISGAIAAAVEEQDATTKEISRNVMEAAKGTSEVASNITDVSKGASDTGSASTQVLSSAKQLAGESGKLRREVDHFLQAMRAA